MNRYLLDTDMLIDFFKGREPVVSRINKWIANGNTIGVCPINITEFYAGLPQSERKVWDDFFESLICWPVTREAGRSAGVVRAEYKKNVKTITTTDATI